ncbi:concanavalin A-like lectin/glucanase domain-containing protein [Syncephalis plumigaleata]|nr:concanavalin A-like lectin/glucanase domain-containing protein [Syncephalis plumigaleata]
MFKLRLLIAAIAVVTTAAPFIGCADTITTSQDAGSSEQQEQQQQQVEPLASCSPIIYNFDQSSDLDEFTNESFENNYCQENAFLDQGNLVLRLTSKCGPSIGPSFEYRTGKVEARIRTGRTNGVVTSIYLRSGIGPDGTQDEVDIEFVGKDPDHFQSFYWVNGQRGQDDPIYHDTGSDTSETYHVYGIDYQEDTVSWLLDGTVIRTLYRSDASMFPTQPMRFKVTLWDGSDYDNWAGKSSSSNFPQYAYFDWIKFTPNC